MLFANTASQELVYTPKTLGQQPPISSNESNTTFKQLMRSLVVNVVVILRSNVKDKMSLVVAVVMTGK
ncbi:hypothetical protein FF38_09394 [Lucilia cuprina]|uniref:Uncharacterized protein n=1 Tax=Lucilia cuprina TaxID=7375 RepID=A0A0L0CQX7_LUCCU|nr:hypothetical protein FF38_09394 [Lucilia cuprina]